MQQAYIDILAKELGMELTASSAGSVTLEQDGKIILLQWNAAENAFVVYAELGHLKGYNDGAVCRQLLSANFLLMETGGGVLSYDSVRNMVGFNYVISVNALSGEEFLLKVNAVLLLAEQWKETLKKMLAEQEERVLQKLTETENLEMSDRSEDSVLSLQFIKV